MYLYIYTPTLHTYRKKWTLKPLHFKDIPLLYTNLVLSGNSATDSKNRKIHFSDAVVALHISLTKAVAIFSTWVHQDVIQAN